MFSSILKGMLVQISAQHKSLTTEYFKLKQCFGIKEINWKCFVSALPQKFEISRKTESRKGNL